MNQRTISLIGEENYLKIKNSKVAIFGLGGVGGTCFESLLRSGIENFYLCDFDTVSKSNLNRQILFTANDIGKLKTDCAKARALSINSECNIEIFSKNLAELEDFSFLKSFNYVIDCIDDVEAKVKLITYCSKNNINIVVALGAGKKINPGRVKIVPINKTTDDPLARKIRYLLKQNNVDLSKIYATFSDEKSLNNDKEISSMIFVPSSAGIYLAYYIISNIINLK